MNEWMMGVSRKSSFFPCSIAAWEAGFSKCLCLGKTVCRSPSTWKHMQAGRRVLLGKGSKGEKRVMAFLLFFFQIPPPSHRGLHRIIHGKHLFGSQGRSWPTWRGRETDKTCSTSLVLIAKSDNLYQQERLNSSCHPLHSQNESKHRPSYVGLVDAIAS